MQNVLFVFSEINDDDYYYDDDETCKKCTWYKYLSNEILSCNSDVDDECQLGIGFLRKDYGLFDWVGDKCYVVDDKNGATAPNHVSGSSGQIRHHSSTVSKP